LIDFCVDGDDIYMAELRPNEGGRFAIVQIDSNGKKTTLLPEPWNAQNFVHE